MKYLILTSSIFYLLGLKMTHNIEINRKMDADTVQIIIPAEKNMPKAENEKSPTIESQSSKSQDTSGSNQLTAPEPSRPVDKVD